VKKHNRNITKFHKWFLTEVEKNPEFFEGDVNSLFVDINYEAFDDKEELLESESRSGEKCIGPLILCMRTFHLNL
jgi:hypothetical protein